MNLLGLSFSQTGTVFEKTARGAVRPGGGVRELWKVHDAGKVAERSSRRKRQAEEQMHEVGRP